MNYGKMIIVWRARRTAQAERAAPTPAARPIPGSGAADWLLARQAHGGNQMVLRLLAAAGTERPQPADGLATQLQARLGAGEPLAADVRSDMESRLGHDFGAVVIHRDAAATDLAARLSARAFTTGQDVFFGRGAYNPGSPEGRATLAHELTHTVQQSAGPVAGREVSPSLFVSDPNDADERAAAAVARDVDRAHGQPLEPPRAGDTVPSQLLSIQRQGSGTIVAPPERIPGPNDPLTGTTTGDLAPRPPRPLLRLHSEGQVVAELQVRLNEDGQDPRLEPDGDFGGATDRAVRAFQRRHGLKVDGIVGPQTWGMLDELSRADILGPHDVLAGSHAVSDAEAAAVAGHMSTTPPAPGRMTGAGNGGQYEVEIFAALDAYYAFRRARVLPPTTTMGEAQTIGRIAQRLVDDFYSDHIVMASRPPGLNQYHPGSYQLPLADAGTRQVDAEFARLWVEQNIQFSRSDPDAPSPQPGDVSLAHGVDTRRPSDAAEVRRVADKYLQSGRLPTVVAVIRTYPAEASEASGGGHGPVYLGLGDPSFQGRKGRWDLLSGLMHEYLHIAAHPHFQHTAERMGGAARRVLIEGMCDYFRVQAWNELAPRFEADTGLRRDVEGQFFTDVPDPSSIVPHGTYDEIADARLIVSELDRPPPGSGPIPLGSAGGEANVRAAYFMGHVDLLGIGPTTRGDAPAGNLGTRGPIDDTDADIYVVPPGGETLGVVEERTNSTRVFTEDGLGLVDPAQRLAGGTRLRVDGIRYVRAVEDDTRAQVANQNGVELHQLEVANRWVPAAGNTAIPVGTRVMIPSH